MDCRTSTPEEYRNRLPNARKITFKGITQGISQWARTYGIDEKTFAGRIARGWGVERAGTQPIDKKRWPKTKRQLDAKSKSN